MNLPFLQIYEKTVSDSVSQEKKPESLCTQQKEDNGQIKNSKKVVLALLKSLDRLSLASTGERFCIIC